jgi:hypothetical protein
VPASVVPPLSIECVLCGNKMVLIGVERRPQTICTYQCISYWKALTLSNNGTGFRAEDDKRCSTDDRILASKS